ncbi:MAG: DUF3644 domain-containing protein [Candidatus Brocadiales bacterium]|nr:DUF3644 domain-containing protein [Candidatus Brocadiales bacterium]
MQAEVRNHLEKAREAALLAVDSYNRTGTTFRTGAYVVLMTIAWTSLFHAIFLKRKTKPYHRKKAGSSRYERIEGEYRTWELKECLRQFYSSNNPSVRKNLEFLIGLRNKVEHRLMPQLDEGVFGECQACFINLEKLLCAEFGEKYALRTSLTFALQFSEVGHPLSSQAIRSASKKALRDVRSYVDKFRSNLSTDVLSSQEYSYKVFLVPKIGREEKSSDVAVEFVKYDPSKPEEMSKYERIVALIKPKYVSVSNLGGLRPSDVVKQVSKIFEKKFTMHSHIMCYRHFNARPKKGDPKPEFCDTRYCYYDQVHKDYIYTQAWIDFLVQELSKPEAYEKVLGKATQTAVVSGQAL